MANASRKGHMGGGTVIGHPGTGTTDPSIPDEDDLAGTYKARNNDQGDGASRVRKQRTVMPGSQDARNQPDVVEAALAHSGETQERDPR